MASNSRDLDEMPQPRTSERVVRPCWLNIDASGPRVIVSDGLSQSVRHLNDPPTFGSGWLADATGMIHIAGSYDTYKCVDCNIVLSGYKKADRSLNEHVLRNAATGHRCRYLKAKFKRRENELRLLEGLLRFQEGRVAFPLHLLLAKEQYMILAGCWYCVLCSQKRGDVHHPACADMASELKQFLIKTTLAIRPAGAPLYTKAAVPGTVDYALGDIWESDASAIRTVRDFSELGDKANMEHLPWTRDKHRCAACDLFLHSFVVGDTFVGEHIYYIYNEGKRCPYIDARYDRDEILYELGRQRSRRGLLAFPSRVLTAERGYSSVAGLERCLVCGVTTLQEKYLPSLGHDAWCCDMKKALENKLENLRLV